MSDTLEHRAQVMATYVQRNPGTDPYAALSLVVWPTQRHAELLATELAKKSVGACVGCGGKLDNLTEGCSTCYDRVRSRERRRHERAQRAA